MNTEKRLALIAAAVVLGVLLLVLFGPSVREELAPEPQAAWVAIQPAGSDVAVVGEVELPAGAAFELHAVLEARTRAGRTFYYTEAPALRLGDVEIEADSLRPWRRSEDVKVLWFTVEGFRPLLEIDGGEGLDNFRFEDLLRPEWGFGWTVPGSVQPSNRGFRQGAAEYGPFEFGTQRYSVRVEIYGVGSTLTPRQRFESWRGGEVMERGTAFPTVRATLPGAQALPSAAFGLTQIDVRSDAADVVEQLAAWSAAGFAFTKPTLLRDTVAAAGRTWGELEWSSVDLEELPAWGVQVAAGDLLRVGERVVVLYEDRGAPGSLDYEDLCFDYSKGAAVRSLAEVFEGGGLIEHTALE